MSDTPRTDDQIGYEGTTDTFVRIDFARQLERELNQVKLKYGSDLKTAESLYKTLLKEKEEWMRDNFKESDCEHVTNETIVEVLRDHVLHFTPSACHLIVNLAISRLSKPEAKQS